MKGVIQLLPYPLTQPKLLKLALAHSCHEVGHNGPMVARSRVPPDSLFRKGLSIRPQPLNMRSLSAEDAIHASELNTNRTRRSCMSVISPVCLSSR